MKIDKNIVLSIDRLSDRWTSLDERMKKIGMEYTLFRGYDAKAITNPSFSKMTKRVHPAYKNFFKDRPDYRPKMKIGHMCCTMGHLALFKLIQTMGWENTLVMEDDVIFCQDFNERMKFLDDVPEDADMIYLGLGNKKAGLRKKDFVTENVYDLRRTQFFATHSFIVTKKGIDPLIKEVDTLEDVIDAMILDAVNHDRLKAYMIYPNLTYQMPYYSETEQRNTVETQIAWCETLYKDKL